MHAVHGPPDAGLSVTLAYDAIAAGYDADVAGDHWMRQALHAHYGRLFRPGQRVLDVGCGTGIDAVALASMGVNVLAVDASSAMIAGLRQKVRSHHFEALVRSRVCRIQDFGELDEAPFDGLISAFASLSSLPHLADFALQAARLVRPGGRAVLHLLNRFSLWEWLGYVAHYNWSAAARVGARRRRSFVIGGESVDHRLYFAREAFRDYFEGKFALRTSYGLGALRPPHTVRRIPAPIVGALQGADVRLGHWPLVRDAGRFFVLDLERRPA